MNARDERGWRIPRRGTLSWDIYFLMTKGCQRKAIINLLKLDPKNNSVSVLMCSIKRPEIKNASTRRWNERNPEKIKARNRSTDRSKGIYSSYVRKLVTILGISFAEAMEIERKELEKDARKAAAGT